MLFEKIVATVDQSKKLKELGISQAACLYWTLTPILEKWVVIPVTSSTLNLDTAIAAYTDGELAVMLDAFYETYINTNSLWTSAGMSIYKGVASLTVGEYDTPAKSSAERLIQLLENDERLTVEMANTRLSNLFKI